LRLQTAFDDVYVQPAASDAGTSLGVAYYIYHHLLSAPRSYVMNTAATGPEFDDRQVATVLDEYGLTSRTLDDDALCRTAAQLLAEGRTVGGFQGRTQCG